MCDRWDATPKRVPVAVAKPRRRAAARLSAKLRHGTLEWKGF
jgi:hypothetical protein